MKHMDALDTYLKDNYELITDMALTITKGRQPDGEELAHETIMHLYRGDREKLCGMIDRKQIKYWIARIMLNQYNSSTSAYHYQYRVPERRHADAKHEIEQWHSTDGLTDKHNIEPLYDFIDTHIAELPYFERVVTLVYYHHNHSLNTLAAATGISRMTLWKAIKTTRDAIKEKYQETHPQQGAG